MAERSIDRISAQLRELVMEDRAERLARHCMAVTQALLTCPEHLKGVTFKCNGDVVLAAHKFILGTQTPCVTSACCRGSGRERLNIFSMVDTY